jgi:long-chain acyl-CoA synthetase
LIEHALEDGWFRTGALMRQDEKGNLGFVGRKKRLIIRGGSNISPVEVEQVLVTHLALRHAAVVGVPDPELGQLVVGFVQLASSAQSANLDEIRAHVAQQIADDKVPENLTIVREISRNALYKSDRNLLLTMISVCEQRDTTFTVSGLA